jgi:hypothetical protein
MISMSLREIKKNWTLVNRLLYRVFLLIIILYWFYFYYLNSIISRLPLHDWTYKNTVGWILLGLLTVSSIVIILTGKEIRNYIIQQRKKN